MIYEASLDMLGTDMIAGVTRFCAALGLVVPGLALAGSSHAAECPAAGAQPATVAAVEPRLELRLTDGRLLRLVGLDPVAKTPSDPDRAEAARRALADQIVGHAVTFDLLSNAPDRWGRLPARVFLADRAQPGGLAAETVALGLGRYRAEPSAAACRDALLSMETKARDAKLGLWADPYYSVLAVDDQAAFAERSATIVIAEARLASVDSGPFRTKLHFAAQGSFGRHLLTASILPHVLKTFEARGVTFEPLIGRRLRLRGLLDLRFGPQIELTAPDEVEVLDAPAVTSTR